MISTISDASSQEIEHELEEAEVLASRTAIVIPFRKPSKLSPRAWQTAMLGRRIPSHRDTDEFRALWKIQNHGPEELNELDWGFQRNIRPQLHSGDSDQGSHWLVLENHFLQRYTDAGVVFGSSKNHSIVPIKLTRIEVMLMNNDSGLLVIHIQLPESAISEVPKHLFALRHLHIEGRARGWVFLSSAHATAHGSATTNPSKAKRAYRASLGSTISAAFHDCVENSKALNPASLGAFANWLLLLDGESPDDVDPKSHREHYNAQGRIPSEGKVGLTRYAKHQSVFVLRTAPSVEAQEALLFRLRRAATDHYQMPRDTVDRILRPRANRMIGISREGVASLSWLQPGVGDEFEIHQWPAKFVGIYLCLALHVLIERGGLATKADQLSDFMAEQPGHLDTCARGRLSKHIYQTMDLTVRMTGRDCGGPSEYRDFFCAMRDVYDIDSLLEELRNEVRDLSYLMDNEHQDMLRQRAEAAQAEEGRVRQQSERMNGLLATVGFLLVPLTMVQGLAILFPSFFSAENMTSERACHVLVPSYLAAAIVAGLWWRWARKARDD